MGPKQSQATKSQVYTLSILNTLFFMNSTKFLNVTTAPTYNSPNHIAMTIPMFLYLSVLFLLPADPQATFHSLLTVTIVVIYALPSQFLLVISN